jgi:uncharacterized protein (TIGR02246 family)
MKQWTAICALLALGFSFAAAQSKSTSNSSAESALIKNEKALWQAWKSGDSKPFAAWLAADATVITPDGQRTDNGAKSVTDLMKTCKINSAGVGDVKVTWLSKDVALLTYMSTEDGSCGGQRNPEHMWNSSIWSKNNGKWALTFHQETVVPPRM